jgi:ectoine hydroxylase-related dioxygenase (phytanoyl-CoA dioxygenase family)
MSFFCSEGFCTEDELAELRSDLLSKYNVDTERVLSHPKERYLHAFVLSDIPSVERIAEKALAYVKSQTLENDWFLNYTRGAVALMTAARGVKRHQPWHRDATSKSYTVCIPLVRVTEYNGCTEILMNSTRSPASRWRKHIKERKRVICNAGSIYVFDSRLLHRGTLNTQRQNRPILGIDIRKPNQLHFAALENWIE